MIKALLGLFGEYRTFNEVIPQLKGLDKVDVVVSTWTRSSYDNKKGEITIKEDIGNEDICKYIPNIKKIFLNKPIHSFPKTEWGANSYYMYYHWKRIVNHIKNIDEYDLVILHRMDMISNWETILENNWDSDTLYNNYGPGDDRGRFIDDWFIFGSPKVIKKIVKSIDLNDPFFSEPHLPLGSVIKEHQIKLGKIDFKLELIR